MVEGEENTQVIGELYSLAKVVGTNGRCVTDLHVLVVRMRLTDAAVLLEESAESGKLSSSASERTTRWRANRKGESGSSRRSQERVRSGTGACREPDTGPALAGMSESSVSDYSRGRYARIRFSSKHPSGAVVMRKSRSACRKDMDEKRNGYARAGIATYIIAY